jgi:hypothetical protein
MDMPSIAPGYDELLAYLVDKATPEDILAFEVSEAAKARARVLVERHNEGILSPEEAVELEQIRQVNHFVALLKLRAMEALDHS